MSEQEWILSSSETREVKAEIEGHTLWIGEYEEIEGQWGLVREVYLNEDELEKLAEIIKEMSK